MTPPVRGSSLAGARKRSARVSPQPVGVSRERCIDLVEVGRVFKDDEKRVASTWDR
jgi:hypothetical protein